MMRRESDGSYGHHEESDLHVELRSQLPSDQACDRMANLASAFSDPSRVRLLSLLARKSVCVGDIAIILGRSQSTVSHQLKLLKSVGLVRSARQGKHIYYSLVTEAEGELLKTLEDASAINGDTP